MLSRNSTRSSSSSISHLVRAMASALVLDLALSGVGHGSSSCCLRVSIFSILKILLAIPNILSQVVPPDVLL